MSEDTRSRHEKRHYDAITPREFKSSIPPHLLANLPDDERFMVETMSKLENQFVWLSDGLVKSSQSTLDLDDRVSGVEQAQKDFATQLKDLAGKTTVMETQGTKVEKLWDWKNVFSGKWAILAAIVIMILPMLLKFVFDALLKWLKH